MTIDTIREIASAFIAKYRGMTLEEICAAEDILVVYRPMGARSHDCKGFFTRIKRMKSIFINADLPEVIQRIILYHELGHAILHGNVATEHLFHDSALFDQAGQYEYEANLFAAELAMSDEDVLEQLNQDMSIFAAAARLRVPPELLDMKLRILKSKGLEINCPLQSRSSFMKDIDRRDRF